MLEDIETIWIRLRSSSATSLLCGAALPAAAAGFGMKWPISTRANKPENDDPVIVEPIELTPDAEKMANNWLVAKWTRTT